MPTRRTERRASALPPRPAPLEGGGGPSEDKKNEREEPIMVISSLVVETMPDRTDDVARELAQREGVEVHETNGHKIVVTIEAEPWTTRTTSRAASSASKA